jgi:hypothetical protein
MSSRRIQESDIQDNPGISIYQESNIQEIPFIYFILEDPEK